MSIPSMIQMDLGFSPRRYSYMECTRSLEKFTLIFYHHFLALNNEWFSSFRRLCQVISLDIKQYYIVQTVIIHDNTEVKALGASFDESSASDISCYFLSLKLRELKKDFMMPKNLLGYPNFHGSCFLISSVLPLFHCYPFVCRLLDHHLDFSTKYLSGEYYYNSDYHFDEEVPFFWVDLLYRVYIVYQEVASCRKIHDDISSLYFLLSESSNRKKVIWNEKDRSCLDMVKMLDETLSTDLTTGIVRYCDPVACQDGGDERQMTTILLKKIASEIPDFYQDFALRFTCSYLCTTCTGGPFTDNFYSSVVRVHPDTNFQDLLTDPVKCFSKQKFYSIHDTIGSPCNSRIHSVSSCTFTNVPEILVFVVSYCEKGIYSDSPEELILEVFAKKHSYTRLSYSICFPCYVGKNGKDYGCFYHPYETGDVCLGEHTCIHINTKNGLYEVNNGAFYVPDDRLKNKVMPGSVHFYQLKKYNEYIPEICLKHVLKNPLY